MSARSSTQKKPVILVQHARYEHPAAIRRALECQGIRTVVLHPYRGEGLPNPEEISGMISMGGPMGANDGDRYPWINQEIELLRLCVDRDYPVVGICLGGQMLSKALGGEVRQNEVAEVGWIPIQISDHGEKDKIIGAAGSHPLVYQWHFDTFTLPPGSTLLAESKACPRQAYKIGEKAYGFQFHPEADHQLVHEWLSIDGVEEDVLAVQKIHGKRTVQDANSQRAWALKGEKASLKITAAISQLFTLQPYGGVSDGTYASYEAWTAMRTPLIIEFEDSEGKAVHLRGHIVTLLTVPDGEFIIFKEESTVLWPIRMDYVTKVMPASR